MLTYTVQPVSFRIIKKTETGEDVPDVNILNENICGLLSIYDSLNKLCETLKKLECVARRKNIEINLTKEGKGVLFEHKP